MKHHDNPFIRTLHRGRYIIALAVGQLAAVGAMAALITLTDANESVVTPIEALREDDPLRKTDPDEVRDNYIESLAFDDNS